MRSSDNTLPHLMEVRSGDRFRKGKLASEDRRDTNLARFNVCIWRDDGTGSIVDSFTLFNGFEKNASQGC